MKICLLLVMIFFNVQTSYSQGGLLSGDVENTAGHKLPFVAVSLKNTNYSTITDDNGRFKMSSVVTGEYTLVVSHVGFKSFEKKIKIGGKPIFENVVLISSVTELDEISVKAEKQTRIQETKPIAISSIEIKNVISQNVLITDVVDRLSGVRIRRSSSLGDNSDISINGMRGNAVRIYIDGLPMEFIYPNFDISTLPIGNLKRIDVYKGVLPVNVGTDALGGGINLITEQKSYNSLKASYNVGSFNTHLGDLTLGLANAKNYFVSVSGAYNYSDNDYKMDAPIFEKNSKIERVRRFHDRYHMAFGSITVGAHSKPWADELKLTLNLSGGEKQLQNGARVTGIAFGEANYRAKNLSAILKYDKSFSGERGLFTTTFNYSDQTLGYVDTTRNVYSWSGKIVGKQGSR